ncbi:hypothetical protein L3Y34_005991 [Caenorhabditis briggsae]|uniref:Lipid-binding serum glycoprotein C-terminal domain-containing protein n=1 Tax=Caenorhabditis briggsae TaxID=6238 RepID=A0AAE9CWY2_CAEBR|nr:hypothetical protein L3Y34_005991 [Caenorhabditis briggsae]
MQLFRWCLIILLIQFVVSIRQVNVQKQWYRYPGNPGVRIRLTKKGANHIKTVGVQIFNDYISQLKGYSTSMPFSQIGINGIVNLKNLHVKNYRPPQVSVLNFLPPRHVVLGLENLDIGLGSDFTANAVPIVVEGNLMGTISGMTVALTTELLTDVTGKMNAVVRNCSALIANSHITINPTGPMGIFVKTFEPMINDSVRQRIPEIFCSRLQNLVEKNISKLFEFITKINLEDYFPKMDKSERDVMNMFISHLAKGMYVDNRMITQPLLTMDYIETNHQGEIQFESLSGPTPFFPRPMEQMFREPLSDHMAHFYVSDHLLNSMLYYAYQDNRLALKIDESNLPKEMKSFVSTQCPSKRHQTFVCVGYLVPEIGKLYPDSTTSFAILPHGLPYVMFNRDGMAVEIKNRILTYAIPDDPAQSRNRSQILVFSINGQADIKFSPTSESLNARMNLNRFNVRLHRSAVRGIDETSIARLSPLSKTFIAPRLSAAVEKAARFPLQDTIKFINPVIKNYDGFISLSTDFQLEKKKIKSIVRNSIEF